MGIASAQMTREQIIAASADCLDLIQEARQLGQSLVARLSTVRDA